jgi:hypothetical protein
MYPYKINWATESLRELHEDNSYGYADNLSDIKKEIYKYIDEYIYEYEKELKVALNNESFSLNVFFRMVNSEPYYDFMFLDVKYFDFAQKIWKHYEINEPEIEQYILTHFTSSII